VTLPFALLKQCSCIDIRCAGSNTTATIHTAGFTIYLLPTKCVYTRSLRSLTASLSYTTLTDRPMYV